ncbi:Nucleolar protein [Actinidia chinensis var. chinensis]|uniref:Nucleolar protein n=1 Tax=Actinidia chinensis var. chinensis TaxID=1590841 RepID=A0A2R6RLC4_ACTCC|nr:Nucleolar protein [Actinidia chinensis var. chinensis]
MASETLTNRMDFKVRELLKEVQLDYSPSFTKLVDETVSAIREAIHQIPEDLQEYVAPDFVKDIRADKVEFKFKKPKSIEIGGSYSMCCIAKPDVNVDLFIRMPKECFHEKDYLNYCYHAKRFLYLCIVKKYLKLSSVAQKVEWSTFQNEARKPILVVHPAMKLVESPQLVVRIIPTAKSVFNVSKLNLDRSNVRALNQGGVLQATPKYNSSMLEDLFLEDNAEFVKRTFLGWKELGEALILLKVYPIAFSASLLEAFEVLSKRLRLLNDIPLRVSSAQPLDSAFRFTSVFPPRPHPLAVEKTVNLRLQKFTSSCIHPLEVMIQLEGSGNWPMDEVAIEKTKSAFLLKIGESLQNNWGMACNPTEDDVVVFTSGYAFRLKALHERGLNLLKRQIGSNQVKWVPSTDKILSSRGQHSSMINGLQGRFPIYGPVRLAKRWVAAYFFSTSLEEEAVELLVAYLFLKHFPFYTPCSRIVGFLRFLRLLSEYDWAFSALIVDINGDLTLDDEKEINGNFTSSRKAYDDNMQNISPAIFLATSYDKASEAWTKSSPSSSDALLEIWRQVPLNAFIFNSEAFSLHIRMLCWRFGETVP